MRSRIRDIPGFRPVLALLMLLCIDRPLLAAPVVTPPTEVTITNDLNETIYGLYLWPSDLVPRTYSVLNTPLGPNRDATVRVDNVYGDCKFTFRADLKAPKGRAKIKIRQYRKPRPRDVYLYEINLCGRKAPVSIADPIGSNYGP